MRLRNTYKNVMEHGMKEGILDSNWKAVLHFWRRMIAKIDAVNKQNIHSISCQFCRS